ncbi:MAG: PEGA domain-containing protein, partial [Chitinophagaceae bacterium]
VAHGPLQKFVIISEPRVTSIYIDGKDFGKTPAVVRLSRRKNHILQLKLDGYETYEVKLKRKIDGWVFGNIALGGIAGIGIDLLTGSMYRLTPKDIYPTLVAKTPSNGSDVALMITLKPDPSWQKIGEIDELTK